MGGAEPGAKRTHGDGPGGLSSRRGRVMPFGGSRLERDAAKPHACVVCFATAQNMTVAFSKWSNDGAGKAGLVEREGEAWRRDRTVRAGFDVVGAGRSRYHLSGE